MKLLRATVRGSDRVGARNERDTAMFQILTKIAKLPRNEAQKPYTPETARAVTRQEIAELFAQDLGYRTRAA